MAGGGVAFGLGGFGLIAANGAVSERHGKSGGLGSVSFDARAGAVSIFATASAAAGAFADMAAAGGSPYPRLRYQAGGNANFGRYGSLAVSLIGAQPPQGRFNRLVNGSYSLSVGRGVYLGMTGFYNLTDRSSTAEIFLSVPLHRGVATASASVGSGNASFRAAFDKPADPDGGVGFHLSAGTRAFDRAEGGINWVGDDGVAGGDVALASGKFALRGDAAGGIVLMDGGIYATREPDGASALVDAGAPHVRIYRENRQVAVSNGDGKALLTGLIPYAGNRIGVEPRDYPMTAIVAEPQRIVVPPRGAVVDVSIAPVARHAFVATVRLENGVPPPVGALVYVAGHDNEAAIVGRGGEVFFANFGPPGEALIRSGALSCQVWIDPPASARTSVPRIGPLTCYRDVADAH
jgi:outer membrane usher protein